MDAQIPPPREWVLLGTYLDMPSVDILIVIL